MNVLDKELLGFLSLEIPLTPPRQEGFLDIVKCQYHENTITQVYAYFLNRSKNPVLANLFLNALLEVIEGKDQQFFLNRDSFHECFTEYSTNKGNRIDLVILFKDDLKSRVHDAIIIENKIFSSLHNDLEDYYESVDAVKKIGVVLTLRKLRLPDKYQKLFINITHLDWIKQIRLKGLPADLSANEYVYLNDFIRNMECLSESNSLPNDARFFFEHASKIIRAQQTSVAAFNFVVGQLNIFADKLEWSFSGGSNSWRHIRDKESQLYYSIVFDKMISANPELTVFLEINGDALRRDNLFRNILKENGVYDNLNDDKKVNNVWSHLAYKTYTFNIKDIENLSDLLYNSIKSDFKRAYELIDSAIKNQLELS